MIERTPTSPRSSWSEAKAAWARRSSRRSSSPAVAVTTASSGGIIARCRAGLAEFKVPRSSWSSGRIPRSPLGKILRKYLV